MNFVFVGNQAYLEVYLPNLLRSIQATNYNPKFHIICNTDFNIPGFEYIKYIDKDPIVKKYNRNGELDNNVNEHAFLKMSMFKLLPKDIYMYMDVDCIVLKDLSYLGELASHDRLVSPDTIWGFKLGESRIGNTISIDNWVPRSSNPERWNTGFFCFDLSKFDGYYDVAKDYINNISDLNSREINGDTTVFNDTIKDYLSIPQEWNWCTGYLEDVWDVARDQVFRYIEMGQLNNLKSIHYSGKNKPWNSKCLYYEEWRKYN